MPTGAVQEGKVVSTQLQRACGRCISTRFSLYGAAQAGDVASVKRLVEVANTDVAIIGYSNIPEFQSPEPQPACRCKAVLINVTIVRWNRQ